MTSTSNDTAASVELQFIAPTFVTTDIQRMIDYYTDKLGFSLVGNYGNFAIVERDIARINFQLAETQTESSVKEKCGCVIYVDNVDALHTELKARGAEIDHPPITRDYGYRDFTVLDPEGYGVLFSQHLHPE